MKKLGKWWQWALLAAFAAALVFGAVQAKQVGDHLQYLVPAPAQQTEDNSGEDENSKTAPNQPIADQVKALENAADEWDTTTMLRWTIGGVIEKRRYPAETSRRIRAWSWSENMAFRCGKSSCATDGCRMKRN